MTRKQAKKSHLKVWRYFRDHPGIGAKGNLPASLWESVENLTNACALCSLFIEEGLFHRPLKGIKVDCKPCPLPCCYEKSSWYTKWESAKTPETRSKYAGLIVKAVEEWDV